MGHYTLFEYDDFDRVTREVAYDAVDTAVAELWRTYDDRGGVLTQRRLASPGGSDSTADALVEMVYDAEGRLLTRTTHLTASDGPTTAYSYDDDGNMLTQVVDPATLALTTIHAYDDAGRITRTTQPDGAYAVMVYDGLGRMTKVSGHASGGTAFAVSEMRYDDDLNVVTKSYQYADPASQSAFNASTDPSQAQLYDANGRLTATEDAHGHTTSFAYDDLGRRVTTTDPASNKQVVVYDAADRVVTQLQLDYDGVNHVTFAVAMEYDDLGRATRQIAPGPSGDLATTADNLTTTLWFDARGQVTQQEDPSGQAAVGHYDALGRLTRTIEDANGLARYTNGSYDRSDRLLTLTGYDGVGGSTSGAQHTVYAYAKSGVLTRATYPDDDVSDRGFVSFHFDSVLRLTRQNHPDNTNTDVVYDVMGRRLTVIRGTEVDSFTYTVAGQLASAKRGTSGTPDAVSEVERLYDDLLRLTRERQSVKQGTTRNVDYAYDLGGSVITRTYPDATAFSYSYTDVDQLDTLKRGGTTLASYSYVGHRPTELELPTGTAHAVVQSHTYDGMGRLTRLSQARNGTELATFAHGYDTVGNITSRTFEHRPDDPSEDYTYDSLYRLTHTTFGQRQLEENEAPYQGFIYDHLGNHLTQLDQDAEEVLSTIAGVFNDVNEQTDRDANSLAWSLRGNLTEDDAGQQYAYDRSNLLTKVLDDQDATVATYAYDALGRRIEKDVAGGDTTHFYYDGQQLIEERDDSGDLQRQYVWGGIYIDELLLFTDVIGEGGTADADYLALRHHNFNVVALVDRSTGSVVERYDYNPYGSRTVLNEDFTTHSDPIAGDFAFAIGHQGLMHDPESGLVYNRARMLHPKLGRFVQRDPLGYVDGMSVYLYVRAAPLTFVDPQGSVAVAAAPILLTGLKIAGWAGTFITFSQIFQQDDPLTLGQGVPTEWEHIQVGTSNGLPALQEAALEVRAKANKWPDAFGVSLRVWFRDADGVFWPLTHDDYAHASDSKLVNYNDIDIWGNEEIPIRGQLSYRLTCRCNFDGVNETCVTVEWGDGATKTLCDNGNDVELYAGYTLQLFAVSVNPRADSKFKMIREKADTWYARIKCDQ